MLEHGGETCSRNAKLAEVHRHAKAAVEARQFLRDTFWNGCNRFAVAPNLHRMRKLRTGLEIARTQRTHHARGERRVGLALRDFGMQIEKRHRKCIDGARHPSLV